MVSCSGNAFSRVNYAMHDFLTAHGFDVLLTAFSPSIPSALYDVDRFLALLLNKQKYATNKGANEVDG